MRYLLSFVEAVGGSSLIECLSGSAGLGWAGVFVEGCGHEKLSSRDK